jgi:hypothetical protein
MAHAKVIKNSIVKVQRRDTLSEAAAVQVFTLTQDIILILQT